MVSGVRFQPDSRQLKCDSLKLKSEPQNRRISNIEFRRVVSLRSILFLNTAYQNSDLSPTTSLTPDT
ncbi:hypothetical protein D1BOALGB6SA_6338 [Olavius sp. associated proteobacterium Delta 1]|nr:hypothetical protein D1BOALGB6SA_6338 [Olavius sp. associated proteobacterium Delta 1]